MSNEKKTPQRAKSRKITRPKEPRTDLFCTLCKTDLHVECVKEYRFHPTRLWRFDYAIPSAKIALEVEGGVWSEGRHIRPQGFLGDVDKYNTAAVMGWRLFRTTPDMLLTRRTLIMLKTAITGQYDPEKDIFWLKK